MRFASTSAPGRFGALTTLVCLLLLVELPAPGQTPAPTHDHLQARIALRPRQSLSLGASRPSGFLLRARNAGRRCVEFFAHTSAGDTVSLGLLGPGATYTYTLAPGTNVFVQNPPKRPYLRHASARAVLEFEVINGTDPALQMHFALQSTTR